MYTCAGAKIKLHTQDLYGELIEFNTLLLGSPSLIFHCMCVAKELMNSSVLLNMARPVAFRYGTQMCW